MGIERQLSANDANKKRDADTKDALLKYGLAGAIAGGAILPALSTNNVTDQVTPMQVAQQEHVVSQEKLKAELKEGLRRTIISLGADDKVDVEATMKHLNELADKYLNNKE